MRVLKLILGLFVVVILILLVGGLVLPKEYRVERSIMVEAADRHVFYFLNHESRWKRWFPWIPPGPNVLSSSYGPRSGVGTRVTWSGEDSYAVSRTITRSERNSRIETQLDLGPMGELTGKWSLEPVETGVRVTWGINGAAPGMLGGYSARRMDGKFGPDMDKGLARLKGFAEGYDHGDPVPTLEEVIDSDAEADPAIP